jgi:hypothetical protein
MIGHERTSRAIVTGVWCCALIVMIGSAINAWVTYSDGDNRVLGLATGLAVDIGLCVALVGDRFLARHGLTSRWGRVLMLTTAGMSLVLNVGTPLRAGHYYQAFLHAFVTLLIVLLAAYGLDFLLKLAELSATRKEEMSDTQQQSTAPAVVAALATPELPASTVLSSQVAGVLARVGTAEQQPVAPLAQPTYSSVAPRAPLSAVSAIPASRPVSQQGPAGTGARERSKPASAGRSARAAVGVDAVASLLSNDGSVSSAAVRARAIELEVSESTIWRKLRELRQQREQGLAS